MTFVITFQNRLQRPARKSRQLPCGFRIGGKVNETRRFYHTDGWNLDHIRWILKIKISGLFFPTLTGFFEALKNLLLINATRVSCREILG